MNYLVISINSTMIVKLPGPHPGLEITILVVAFDFFEMILVHSTLINTLFQLTSVFDLHKTTLFSPEVHLKTEAQYYLFLLKGLCFLKL
jgi:hypothetical protein